MPTATIDGIATYYEVIGDGPPLLMFSPGGFNATLENWRSFGIYERLNLLEHMSKHYTCVTYDRREAGRSGGRVERIGWGDYAAQGSGLLDELRIGEARLMGGCIGCSIAAAFAVAHPERTTSMVLYSPAGGARYRITQHARFAEHIAFVREEGLAQVVELVSSDDKTFAQDPRVGPWANVIRNDRAFAEDYVRREIERYVALLEDWADSLFDRDTVPGAEPEDLLALEIPALVVTSAARYLEECLPRSEYWDVPVAEQTEEIAAARVLQFLQSNDSPRSSAAI
jgi:pimeloyl-ACP methyl ester carboxylesterase